MTELHVTGAVDLIRWTFAVNPDHCAAIVEHLNDLGPDVLVRDGTQVHVLWDEPEGNLDDVVEAIWDLNGGEPFEITQEEFQRQTLVHLHHDDAEDALESDRAA
jgi:hypothetical protein